MKWLSRKAVIGKGDLVRLTTCVGDGVFILGKKGDVLRVVDVHPTRLQVATLDERDTYNVWFDEVELVPVLEMA